MKMIWHVDVEWKAADGQKPLTVEEMSAKLQEMLARIMTLDQMLGNPESEWGIQIKDSWPGAKFVNRVFTVPGEWRPCTEKDVRQYFETTPIIGDTRALVRTCGELESTRGMLVSGDILENRQPNRLGLVLHYTPGHGGDLWTVLHGEVEDGVFIPNWSSDTKHLAVYLYSELQVPMEVQNDGN